MPVACYLGKPALESDVTLGTVGAPVLNASTANTHSITTAHRCLTGDLLVMGAYRTTENGTPNPAIKYVRFSGSTEQTMSRHVHGLSGTVAGRLGGFMATARAVPTDSPTRLILDEPTKTLDLSDLVMLPVDLVGWGGLVGAAQLTAYNGASVDELLTQIQVQGHSSLLVAMACGLNANVNPVQAANFSPIAATDTGTSAVSDIGIEWFAGVGGEAGSLADFLAEFAAAHTDLLVMLMELR